MCFAIARELYMIVKKKIDPKRYAIVWMMGAAYFCEQKIQRKAHPVNFLRPARQRSSYLY